MLPFSENDKNIKLCHVHVGYVHNDNLPLGNIALITMSFKTIAGRFDGVF